MARHELGVTEQRAKDWVNDTIDKTLAARANASDAEPHSQ